MASDHDAGLVIARTDPGSSSQDFQTTVIARVLAIEEAYWSLGGDPGRPRSPPVRHQASSSRPSSARRPTQATEPHHGGDRRHRRGAAGPRRRAGPARPGHRRRDRRRSSPSRSRRRVPATDGPPYRVTNSPDRRRRSRPTANPAAGRCSPPTPRSSAGPRSPGSPRSVPSPLPQSTCSRCRRLDDLYRLRFLGTGKSLPLSLDRHLRPPTVADPYARPAGLHPPGQARSFIEARIVPIALGRGHLWPTSVRPSISCWADGPSFAKPTSRATETLDQGPGRPRRRGGTRLQQSGPSRDGREGPPRRLKIASYKEGRITIDRRTADAIVQEAPSHRRRGASSGRI